MLIYLLLSLILGTLKREYIYLEVTLFASQCPSIPKQGARSNVDWRAIFIYSCSHTMKTKERFPLSKEIGSAEHEYMNIALKLTLIRGPCQRVHLNVHSTHHHH